MSLPSPGRAWRPSLRSSSTSWGSPSWPWRPDFYAANAIDATPPKTLNIRCPILVDGIGGAVAKGSIETDYLVVGAGAMGMAVTDALIDHADVHVTLVDRRHTASWHWQDAYPFVQLHQASLV